MASVGNNHIFQGTRSIAQIVSSHEYKTILSSICTAPHVITQILQRYNPYVLFVFTRSKNANILVVEHDNGSIKLYWLMLEDSSIRTRRQRHIVHDYEDLNWIERTKYWRYNVNNMTNRRYNLTFNQMSKIKFIIQSNGSVKCELAKRNEALFHCQGVYIQLGYNRLNIPYVQYFQLFSRNGTSVQLDV